MPILSRCKDPYWRRDRPASKFDIAKLLPGSLPRGNRFETRSDARDESHRSEQQLVRLWPHNAHAKHLRDCREGHYACAKTFCPLCARTFRRHTIGELLRLSSAFRGQVKIMVILLEAAPKGQLCTLRIDRYRHVLRKRLIRTGLADVPVIGGFEMIYRARSKEWVLHINLAFFGGDAAAMADFENGFSNSELYRRVTTVDLEDPAEQLSYLLKFTTYHRPRSQRGASKSKAVPLNPDDHYELVNWMAQHDFTDHLFLFNARRRRTAIQFASKDARKA